LLHSFEKLVFGKKVVLHELNVLRHAIKHHHDCGRNFAQCYVKIRLIFIFI